MPARGAGEASETGREQRLAQPRATDHFDRHGVIRGIQRGTAARNASYSLPNVRSSGVFVRHDEEVEGEPEQRAVDDEAPIAHQHRLTQDDGNDRDVYWIAHITVETGHHEIRVGAMGAGVPRPCSANAHIRERAQAGRRDHYRDDAARQLQTKERRPELATVIDHGTSPVSVHGSTRRNQPRARTAMVRCTAVPATRCELIPTSPSWFPVVIRVPTRSPCYPKSGNRARLKPECHGGNEAQG